MRKDVKTAIEHRNLVTKSVFIQETKLYTKVHNIELRSYLYGVPMFFIQMDFHNTTLDDTFAFT